MSRLFQGKTTFNGDITKWDVSRVATMNFMFYGAEAFDQNINDWGEYVPLTVSTVSMFVGASKVTNIPNWEKADGTRVCFDHTAHATVMKDRAELKPKVDAEIARDANVNLNYLETCNVKDMSNLFEDKTSFNGDITNWDVSQVTTMDSMFKGADAFNQAIGNWNVNKVTNMGYMFKGADAFNQAIGNWDVSKVSDMYGMFQDAKAFNQPLSNWDVSQVTDMRYMFNSADAFGQDLTAWGEHVPLTVHTAAMFSRASKITKVPRWKKADGKRVCFNHTAHVNVMQDRAKLKEKVDAEIARDANVNLNYLETCNVKNMSNLFKDKTTFNGDISQWDVSQVTTMHWMFNNAKAFDGDISQWDVIQVTTMQNMFYDADAFNGDISQWDVSQVTDMYGMFYDAEAFNQPIGDWNVSKVTNMNYMFEDAKKFCKNLESWGTRVSQATKMRMFIGTASAHSSCSYIPPSWY